MKLIQFSKGAHLFYSPKLIRIMRLSTFFLFCMLVFIHAENSYSQGKALNFSLENTTVGQILEKIEAETDYLFLFTDKTVDVDRKIDLSIETTKVSDVLNALFKNTNVHYEIIDNQIILSTRGTNLSALSPDQARTSQRYITGRGGDSFVLGFDQARTVQGRIIDKAGEPLVGVNILIKGTTLGSATDIDGYYTIQVPENAVLIVRYIGYLQQEITVANQTTINITMQEDQLSLDEVVVVGYGVQKKRDLTGAISSVKMDDSPIGTFSTVSHAMAGKAAGLQVTQSSAQVGGGATYRIRGATSINAGNDPLFIVDGFPISVSGNVGGSNRYNPGSTDNILESINPNDIESIEVLKDASATAIYGSRAGHGVIIITTKRGKTGAPRVSYSGNVMVQNIKNNYKMLDAKQYMEQRNRKDYENWLRANGQGIYADYVATNPSPTPFSPRYTDAQIAAAQTTDWFDEVTRTGVTQSHNISLAGGTPETQYMASVNYFSQDGVLKNNAMDRMTVKLNLDQQVSKYVKTGVSFSVSRNDYDVSQLGSSTWENAGLIASAILFDPSVPVRDANGDYSIFPDLAQFPNPVSLMEITNKMIKDRVLASGYVQAEPIKGLILKANLGIDRQYQKSKEYTPNTTMYGAATGGKAYIGQQDNLDYLMDLTANYTKEISGHSISALVGYSYQQFTREGFSANNYDFSTDGFIYNNLGAGAGTPVVSSWASKSALGSYFARLNYSYLGKYLLTATVRADGASNFDPDYRWGYFPSVSLGWRFSDEEFMKPLANILSNGKLRVSYGQTGNSNVGNRILDTYGVGRRWVYGDNGYIGVAATQLGNRKLTWETTSEWNFGIDLGFLNNRISLSMEYYNRIVSDLLVTSKSLPSYNEITTIAANMGETQGRGFELTLNTVNVLTKDWNWTTDFTFYKYKDRWYERDDTWKPYAYQSERDPIRAIFTYYSDGLLQAGEAAPAWQPALLPGQIKIKNVEDEEGRANVLDQYDQRLLGTSDPDFTIGFNNTVRYKGFDFNMYFYGEVGRWRSWSYYDQRVAGADDNPINLSTQTLNSWTHDNQNTNVISVILNSYTAGDYYYRKINYLRCRNITLGYIIPVSKKIANSIRISANVSNPFIITNWSGVDPETDSGTFAYPNTTSFNFGVDITF